jgi:hypothetical protein
MHIPKNISGSVTVKTQHLEGVVAGQKNIFGGAACPSWVKSCRDDPEMRLPLCPETGLNSDITACPKGAQQATSFNHLVGAGESQLPKNLPRIAAYRSLT